MPSATDKRQDFLWLVSLFMHRHADEIQGWHGLGGDAVAASYRIPDQKTARNAALEFAAFNIESVRGKGSERTCAGWVTALRDPDYV